MDVRDLCGGRHPRGRVGQELREGIILYVLNKTVKLVGSIS